ncbi:MAG: S46 family peptidase [Blastocatellia bacterium]|nr:S46 family peptidase [Blastocatellia bacterium]
MLRRTFTFTLLIFSLAFSPFASLADEGMWMPDSLDKLPLAQLRKRGFELKPEEIYSTTKPSMKDAIVQISIGGTGSFISPDGLILTNHHVAFAAVARASTNEADYINKGFLAKSRTEEIPAQGYSVSITQGYKDVTDEVLSAVKPEMTAEEKTSAISRKQLEIQNAAGATSHESDGQRFQVVEATSGYQYFLYTYLTLRDVRLVYVPPRSIGYFGGDPDNFEWPRHSGDFAILRAYAGADGKPAAHNSSNVPFKPKKFLTVNANGIKEGDFAMVMGFPGSTFRYRESYSIEFRQNIQLPEQITELRRRIDTLTELSEKVPSLKPRLADQIFSLSNALKSFEGTVTGLKKMHLVEQKRAEEAAFSDWLNKHPAQKEKYGETLPRIAEAYRELNSFSQKQGVLNDLLDSGELTSVLQFAYLRALEREKPENERASQYGDNALSILKARAEKSWKDREVASESGMLADALERASRLPAEQKLQFIEQMFAGKSATERKKAEADFAKSAVENSKFASFDEVKKLFNATAAEIRASDDPLLKLVVQATDEAEPLSKRTNQFNNTISRLRPDYIRGMLDMKQDLKKGAYYPDANFTLRLSYGDIRGYKPRDAVIYEYQTSLNGVLEKDTGVEPFDVPAKLKELAARRDFGNYIDARLKDIPVAFLTTNDITGGNSGSPVMNGKGEIIGLAFDGNYEGLGGDYAYNLETNRTIAVDIRYALFLLEKFAGADYLFNEMQIKRAK